MISQKKIVPSIDGIVRLRFDHAAHSESCKLKNIVKHRNVVG